MPVPDNFVLTILSNGPPSRPDLARRFTMELATGSFTRSVLSVFTGVKVEKQTTETSSRIGGTKVL